MNFVVLQNMYSNMALLCHYCDTIVNDNNSITYVGGNNVILSAKLDISLAKLKQVIYEGNWWENYEI